MKKKCFKKHNYLKHRHNHNFCGDCGKRLRWRGIFTKLFYLGFLVLFISGCEYLQASPTRNPQSLQPTNEVALSANETNTTNTTINATIIIPQVVIQPRNNSLNLYFLNVQGDAAIIQKGGESMLINGGKEADSSMILKKLRDLGISELNHTILTNPSQDTIGSIPYLILRAKPTYLYESGLNDGSTNYRLMKDVFLNTTIVQHNKQIDFDNAFTKILVLYDDGKGFASRMEDNSLIVKIAYENVRVLFMGYCGFECEERIYDEDLEADIIKLSPDCNANSLVFLQKVNPKIAIVKDTCPEVENRFNNLNIPLYQIKDGDLAVSIKNGSYEVIR